MNKLIYVVIFFIFFLTMLLILHSKIIKMPCGSCEVPRWWYGCIEDTGIGSKACVKKKELRDKINTFIENQIKILKNELINNPFIKTIQGLIKKIESIVNKTINKITEFFITIKNKASKIIPNINSMIQPLISFKNNLITNITKYISGIYKEGTELGSKIINEGRDIITTGTNTVKNINENIIKKTYLVGKIITDSIIELKNDVKTKINSLSNGTINAIKIIYKNLLSAINAITGNVKEIYLNVEGFVSNVFTSIKGLFSKINEAVNVEIPIPSIDIKQEKINIPIPDLSFLDNTNIPEMSDIFIQLKKTIQDIYDKVKITVPYPTLKMEDKKINIPMPDLSFLDNTNIPEFQDIFKKVKDSIQILVNKINIDIKTPSINTKNMDFKPQMPNLDFLNTDIPLIGDSLGKLKDVLQGLGNLSVTLPVPEIKLNDTKLLPNINLQDLDNIKFPKINDSIKALKTELDKISEKTINIQVPKEITIEKKTLEFDPPNLNFFDEIKLPKINDSLKELKKVFDKLSNIDINIPIPSLSIKKMKIFSALSNLLSEIKIAFDNVINKILEIKNIIQPIMLIYNEIVKLLSSMEIIKDIIELVNSVKNTFVEKITNLIGKITPEIKIITNEILNVHKVIINNKIYENMQTALIKFKNNIYAILSQSKILNDIQTIISNFTNIISQIMSKSQEVLSLIKDTATSLNNTVKEIKNTIINEFKSIYGSIVKDFKELNIAIVNIMKKYLYAIYKDAKLLLDDVLYVAKNESYGYIPKNLLMYTLLLLSLIIFTTTITLSTNILF